MKLVLIMWHDALGCTANWQELSDIRNPKPVVCRSVGWLAYDGEDIKVVVPHMTESIEGNPDMTVQGCGDMSIPARAIIEMHDLEVPAPKPSADEEENDG